MPVDIKSVALLWLLHLALLTKAQTPRHDVLLFLLVHLVLSSDNKEHAGLANPWTDYVKLLDDYVPVPTLWEEGDRSLLQGTSLEAALDAKMLALNNEFEELRDKSSSIECWNAAFWDNDSVRFADWLLVDAWYRSRVLELPRSGPSLVPCVDSKLFSDAILNPVIHSSRLRPFAPQVRMKRFSVLRQLTLYAAVVNHSKDANAYYEQNIDGDVVILLRPGGSVNEGDEVSISYGSEKPAAEMLFSYGFIDSSPSMKSLRLPLRPLPDDPIGKAKAHAFQDAPVVDVKEVGGTVSCTSPFAYLMILNEEDGLDFRLLQDNDGGRDLRTFWRDEDVTEKTSSFEQLVSDHKLCSVFRLRVNMVITQRLEEQLERLSSLPLDDDNAASATEHKSSPSNAVNAKALRLIEKGVLDKAMAALEEQVSIPVLPPKPGHLSR